MTAAATAADDRKAGRHQGDSRKALLLLSLPPSPPNINRPRWRGGEGEETEAAFKVSPSHPPVRRSLISSHSVCTYGGGSGRRKRRRRPLSLPLPLPLLAPHSTTQTHQSDWRRRRGWKRLDCFDYEGDKAARHIEEEDCLNLAPGNMVIEGYSWAPPVSCQNILTFYYNELI